MVRRFDGLGISGDAMEPQVRPGPLGDNRGLRASDEIDRTRVSDDPKIPNRAAIWSAFAAGALPS